MKDVPSTPPLILSILSIHHSFIININSVFFSQLYKFRKSINNMAHIDSSCVKAIEFAKTLNPNIQIDNGINWIWAYGFTSKEDAEKFDNFCCNNNCETRGIYSDSKGTYNVRFR